MQRGDGPKLKSRLWGGGRLWGIWENPGGSCQQILPSLNPGHRRGLGSWAGFVLQTAALFSSGESKKHLPDQKSCEKSARGLGLKAQVKPLSVFQDERLWKWPGQRVRRRRSDRGGGPGVLSQQSLLRPSQPCPHAGKK